MNDTTMTETAQRQAIAACSFCRKPNTQVRKLVAGPGVYICDECVDLCVQIIAAEPAGPAGPSRVRLWDQMDNVDEVLGLLPKVAATAAQVDENLTAMVGRARELGATWAKVGEALGMTRQSAWERFSGEE